MKRFWLHVLLTGLTLLAPLLVSSPIRAEDFTLRDGRTITNATVLRSDAASVTLKVDAGIERIWLSRMIDETQRRFGYDASQEARMIFAERESAAQATQKSELTNWRKLQTESAAFGLGCRYRRIGDKVYDFWPAIYQHSGRGRADHLGPHFGSWNNAESAKWNGYLIGGETLSVTKDGLLMKNGKTVFFSEKSQRRIRRWPMGAMPRRARRPVFLHDHWRRRGDCCSGRCGNRRV